MLIFYGEAQRWRNVPAKSAVNASVGKALGIFRGLDPRRGFLGIILKQPFILQMMVRKNGVRIELLDSSIPAADFCEDADHALAEDLIKAAGIDEDIFKIARQRVPVWQRLKM
jgi:hypothetical protein